MHNQLTHLPRNSPKIEQILYPVNPQQERSQRQRKLKTWRERLESEQTNGGYKDHAS